MKEKRIKNLRAWQHPMFPSSISQKGERAIIHSRQNRCEGTEGFSFARRATSMTTTQQRVIKRLATATLVALTATFSPSPIVVAQESSSPAVVPAPLEVSQISTDIVYLTGGRSHHLQVGSLLEVLRGGDKIGTLEVAFVADQSASCRIVDSSLPLEVGDKLVLIPTSAEARRGNKKQRLEAVAPSATSAPPSSSRTSNLEPRGTQDLPRENKLTERRPIDKKKSPTRRKRKLSNLSGTIAYRFQQLNDRSESPRDFDQSTFRLNLRLKNIGGSPYQLRLRVRGQESNLQRFGQDSISDRRDRLYELSFGYQPPAGRFSYQLGRLRSNPLLGFDYLDGALGEVKISPKFGIGGFAGSRSEIDEFGFDSQGQAYGVFTHYQNRSREKPYYSEFLVGGIGEYEEGEVSREYLSIYSRLGSGNKWSIYQRADIDFNRDWRRDASGSSQQISNLLLSGTYRVSEKLRLSFSYDQRRRFRDFESRRTPEELFDDQLRDGVRFSVQLGRPQGWRNNTSIGVRRREGSSEDNYTLNSSIYHSNLFGKKILVGLDFSGFQSESSDGYRLGLRGRKYFEGGHDLGLTLGTATSRLSLSESSRSDRWLRLSGTARLPKRFFVLGEAELSEGDDFQGERLTLQLGYRF